MTSTYDPPIPDFLFGANLGPFLGLAEVTGAVPYPYNCAIGGRNYKMDLFYYKREIISPFREARDTQALPGEASLNPAAAWKRTRDDWRGGAGQLWADRDESNVLRFYSSIGVNPWELGELSLLPEAELGLSAADSTQQCMASGGDLIFMAGNSTLKRVTDLSTNPVTSANITGFTGNLRDMTTDGFNNWVCTSIGIYFGSANTVAAMAGGAATLVCDRVWYANGWLFAITSAATDVLVEVRHSSGVSTTVKDHPHPGFVWRSVAGAPNAIYAAGSPGAAGGGGWQIWSIGTDQVGALATPVLAAASDSAHETINTIHYHAGVLLIGTSRGFRVASIGESGDLTVGPLVEVGNVTDFFGDGNFVWFTWSTYQDSADLLWCGAGRMDLQRFTSPLVPAYATDMMLQNTGVSSSVYFDPDDGRVAFTVPTLGLYVPHHSGNLAAFAEIDFGRFRWGVYEPKIFFGIECNHEHLMGAIHFLALTDEDALIEVGSHEDTGHTGVGEIIGGGTIVEPHDWYQFGMTLVRSVSDPTMGPVIHRQTFRALPVPKVVEEIDVGLVMFQDVNLEVGEGQDVFFDTFQEYEFLRGLVAQGKSVQYQENRTSMLVTVRSVGWADQRVDSLNSQREGYQGILMVQMITVEP